jgi:FtsP/CotA-like multicopper oxidase with cupredoxin domain
MVKRRNVIVGGLSAALAKGTAAGAQQPQGSERRLLRLTSRSIEVNGKVARRYGVEQSSGALGLVLNEGETFDVRLENGLDVASGLHWHGLNPPWRQDGVPYISGPPIAPGQFADYRFPALPAGTRWMHSHFGLQEQNLLAGPLIVREQSALRSGLQEVVILLEDFSWMSPRTIFESLRRPRPMAAMANPTGGMTGGANMGGSAPDLNDVTYEAFLANDRTLADPQVVDVEKGAEVRLRIINGSASSNFMIDLGAVEGTVLTVDGNPVAPLVVRRFPLAIAQRVDIVVRPPADGTALPILARCEGRTAQTGIVLRPRGAAIARIAETASMAAPALTLMEELKLSAQQPLVRRPVDRSVPVELTGDMTAYVWGIAVHGLEGAPVTVEKGERVELVMRNTTMMSHPMHLHGHSFQVTEIDGRPLAGAIRDVILVPPRATVKVAFDADNPGLWAYHCHNLYHLAAGMFATMVYRGFN